MLELRPPFWIMRIKVLELPPDWRRVRARSRLRGADVMEQLWMLRRANESRNELK